MISSMAAKGLLSELARQFSEATSVPVTCEAAGGVDVVKRIGAGEIADLVVLARASIDELARSGLVASYVYDIAQSGIAIAVRAGASIPDTTNEGTLKAAVQEAPSLSYSTGPSGLHMERTFARWGLLEKLRSRIVVPPPGIPVASLVATGTASIGFQQLSELVGVDGITIVDSLPESMQLRTVFAGAVLTKSTQRVAASELLGFLESPHFDTIRRRFGMESVKQVLR